MILSSVTQKKTTVNFYERSRPLILKMSQTFNCIHIRLPDFTFPTMLTIVTQRSTEIDKKKIRFKIEKKNRRIAWNIHLAMLSNIPSSFQIKPTLQHFMFKQR